MNDIEILEKLVERCKECKFACCEQCEINNTQVRAIENLIKENKELSWKYENAKDMYIIKEGDNMENIIKEIKEKIIEPFYVFPNPTSIELSDKDVDLVIDLIKEYKNLKMQLEVEKIDNKYNKEETYEETIPKYRIREKIEELEKQAEEVKGTYEYLNAKIQGFKELLEERS